MNRTLGDLETGKKPSNYVILLVILFLVVFSMFGLIMIGKYIGYATNYFSGRAGYVYTIVLEYRECANLWSGVFGVAVKYPGYTDIQQAPMTSCGLVDNNLLFDCLGKSNNVVMASQVPSSIIDWPSIQAATAQDVDLYLNQTGTEVMSAQHTFLQTVTYDIYSKSIAAPATYTKKTSNTSSNFDIGILKDGNGNLVFITHILDNFTYGFNARILNYQMILPVKNGTNPLYFFFTDPQYTCENGGGELGALGNVEGNASTNSGERLQGVIVSVAGKTTVTDALGHYNISVVAGDYYIFGIKSGYQAYVGNVTVLPANTTYHNIIMVLEAVPNPNTGPDVGPSQDVGPGLDVGPGQDVGPGEVPRVPIVEQPKRIEGIDYIISISKINRKLVVGNFLQEIVSFYSYKKNIAMLNFSIEGENLSKLIKLDKSLMQLTPNSNDQLTLTIFGEGLPGIYNGSLVIDGDLKEKIPITIELLSKDRLPVESLLIMLDVNNKNIYSSENLKFKTDLYNLLSDQSYPVNLQFTIQNSKGQTIWTDNTNVFVQTSFSLLKSAKLPDNLATGDYILRVTANYLGISSGASAIFSVVLPFYERILWGLKIWLWLLLLALLLCIIVAYWLIRRYMQSKKKYAFKLEYSELPKPGPKSAWVGKIAETDNKTYFDLEQFKVHTIVAGATGGGKSVAAQVVVEEALMKNVAVIVFDPTAQWSGMLRKCTDKNMLNLYPLYGMKPTLARAFNGNVRQINNALELIDIKKYIKPGEIQILACNKLDPKDIDIFVANSIREVFHANFSETPEIRLLLVYDEVHRLLPKFGGSGEGFLQIERGCREFRKWGVGILMISQVLADFVGQIKANINTEIQMRTRDEGDLDRIKTKYGVEVLQGLVKASVGSGMVENPTYNRGRPYFVSFRPLLHNTQRLPDEELEKFNKFNELIDDLSFQLDQLEELKQDVFDLKLQVKLALDKVKSGNFNMVEIYLQEVIPRLEKMWTKLGKTPKKRQIKLADINELRADLKKAEESRKQYEKDNQKAQVEEKKEEKKVLKYEKQVPFTKAMNFSNGLTVLSLQELLDVMPNISGPTFKHHVAKDKNDIADWIKNEINDAELAEKIRSAASNTDYVKILEEDKSKNNKPVSAADTEAKKPDIENKTTDIEESLLWKDLKTKIANLEIDDKVKMLEKSEKKYPEELNVKFSLALLYHKKKMYTESENKYKEILEKAPKNLKALYYLGGVLKVENKYDESLEYFNKYLSIKPDDAKVKDLVEKLNKRKK